MTTKGNPAQSDVEYLSNKLSFMLDSKVQDPTLLEKACSKAQDEFLTAAEKRAEAMYGQAGMEKAFETVEEFLEMPPTCDVLKIFFRPHVAEAMCTYMRADLRARKIMDDTVDTKKLLNDAIAEVGMRMAIANAFPAGPLTSTVSCGVLLTWLLGWLFHLKGVGYDIETFQLKRDHSDKPGSPGTAGGINPSAVPPDPNS